MKPYLFTFTMFHNQQPTYYAVREDHSLFISQNWETFFKETKLYPKRLKTFEHGYYINNPELDIKAHEDFTEASGTPILFVVSLYLKIIYLLNRELDIHYYPNDLHGYNEQSYFLNSTFNGTNL